MFNYKTDDDHYIVEIYFPLSKVKAERLPVFNYLQDRLQNCCKLRNNYDNRRSGSGTATVQTCFRVQEKKICCLIFQEKIIWFFIMMS